MVDSVRAGVTGLAYLRNGATAFKALLTRVALRKLYASLCDAIVSGRKKGMGVLRTAVDDIELYAVRYKSEEGVRELEKAALTTLGLWLMP